MNVIYCFSGTGNSLAAAEMLAGNLGDTVIRPMTRELEKGTPVIEAETTGLVFPVYFLGVPAIVREFIEKAEWKSPGYLYITATKGWPVVGAPAAHVRRLLRNKNITLNASFHIRMVENDVLLAGIPEKSKWKKRLESVPGKMRRVSDKIKKRSGYRHPEPTALLLNSRYKVYMNYCRKTPDLFTVNTGKCTGCALCAKICALSNISVKNNKPVYGGNCQLCEACYNVCPEKAISFGRPKLEKEQYRHPGVSLKSLASQKINIKDTAVVLNSK